MLLSCASLTRCGWCAVRVACGRRNVVKPYVNPMLQKFGKGEPEPEPETEDAMM